MATFRCGVVGVRDKIAMIQELTEAGEAAAVAWHEGEQYLCMRKWAAGSLFVNAGWTEKYCLVSSSQVETMVSTIKSDYQSDYQPLSVDPPQSVCLSKCIESGASTIRLCPELKDNYRVSYSSNIQVPLACFRYSREPLNGNHQTLEVAVNMRRHPGTCTIKNFKEWQQGIKPALPGGSGARVSLPDGIVTSDCTEGRSDEGCPADEPTEWSSSLKSCDCIKGAVRGTAGACMCADPNGDPLREGFFQNVPTKSCGFKCRDGTREVFGKVTSTCIANAIYNAVISSERLRQGSCPQGSLEVQARGEHVCLQKEYVDYLLA